MRDEGLHKRIRAFVDSHRRTGDDFRGWTEELLDLPELVRVYHNTWLVEAEVASGGFIHYFSNFFGGTADDVVLCYRALGAVEHARVLSHAIARADEAGSEEEAETLLSSVDDEWFSLAEDAEALREAWLDTHRSELAALLG